MDTDSNLQLETFLEEFEVLLTKTYGENWWYSFDVQEGVLLSLSIPYNENGNGEQASGKDERTWNAKWNDALDSIYRRSAR